MRSSSPAALPHKALGNGANIYVATIIVFLVSNSPSLCHSDTVPLPYQLIEATSYYVIKIDGL